MSLPVFRHLSQRGREQNGDGLFWSRPKSLDEVVMDIHVLILTFLKDGIEKSPSLFPVFSTIIYFCHHIYNNNAFSHLSNYHPVPSLSPPLLPDLTSLKAILSVSET